MEGLIPLNGMWEPGMCKNAGYFGIWGIQFVNVMVYGFARAVVSSETGLTSNFVNV